MSKPIVPHSGPITSLHMGDILKGDSNRYWIKGFTDPGEGERRIKIEAMDGRISEKEIPVSALLERFNLIDVNTTGRVVWVRP